MFHNSKLNISSSSLHILAMGLMLCDHLWAMLFSGGRMAHMYWADRVSDLCVYDRRGISVYP